jgi:hypothetical protein
VNKLFITLYLDEDVDVLLANLLIARGFDVLTVRDAAMRGKSDEEQLAFAISQERALLTHNRFDFEQLVVNLFQRSMDHYGVIIAERRSPYFLADNVIEILNQITADEMINQVIYI